MTVTNLYTDSALYVGNGVTDEFSTRFIFALDAEVLVYKIVRATGVETLQSISTHYTLVGAGTGSAGTITFLEDFIPTSDEDVKIIRTTARTQTTDYVNATKFPANTHEAALDKLTRLIQEQDRDCSRSPRLPFYSVNYPAVFPDWSISTAGYVLRIDDTGAALELTSPLDLLFDTVIPPLGDGDYGDIVVSGSGTVWTLDASVINGVTITAPATGSTLTIADGKTLTASNTLTLTGTDGSSAAFGTGGTVAYTSNKLSAFAATTSAELAGVLSDETGSGALVFGTNPSLTNPTITQYVETVATPTVTAGAVTISLANGTFQKVVTAQNTTITLPSAAAGVSYTILVQYGGVHTITWAGGSTIKWFGGAAPTATSVNGKYDVYVFVCHDSTNTFGADGGRNA